jgi:hypothetical protein
MTPENAIEFRPRFRGQRFAVKARVRLIDDLGKRKARHQIIHTSIYIQGGVTERVAALGRRVTVHTGEGMPCQHTVHKTQTTFMQSQAGQFIPNMMFKSKTGKRQRTTRAKGEQQVPTQRQAPT